MLACLDRFVVFLEQSERSPATIKNYRADLKAFAAWFFDANGEHLNPTRITSANLRDYKRWLVVDRGLKPNSTNRKLASLKCFLHWAADAGLTTDSHALRVPKFERQEQHGPRWLDLLEQCAFLRAVERGRRARDIAIVRLLLNTGLRVQELCVLTWEDVTVTEQIWAVTVGSGKGGKHRQVPLNADARGVLHSVGYPTHAGARAPIFTGQRGPLTVRGVQGVIARYGRIAGLDVSPRTLRHTFCKNLVNAGVGLEQVAALAGHENLEITRQYFEPSLKDLEDAVELLGNEE